jgi:hypothetical protein
MCAVRRVHTLHVKLLATKHHKTAATHHDTDPVSSFCRTPYTEIDFIRQHHQHDLLAME